MVAPKTVSSAQPKMRLLNVNASLDLCGISSTRNVSSTPQTPNVSLSQITQVHHNVSSAKTDSPLLKMVKVAYNHVEFKIVILVSKVRSKTTLIIVSFVVRVMSPT